MERGDLVRSIIRRISCLSVCLGALAALFPASQASAYEPAASPDFFGVNGAMLRNFVSPDKAATLDALATSMNQQGISWARLTFDQAVDEKQRGSFNWYAPDTMVAALARHGVRGAASFVGTATWEADPAVAGNCAWSRAYPADLTGWADWVRAAAQRYGANGTFWAAHPELPKLPIRTWEIGNEVNTALFWCPAADPEQYAKVYSASLNAITAVDGAAQVVVGGLTPAFGPQPAGDLDVQTFLNRLIAADPSLAGRIPAVAIHPYAGSVSGAMNLLAQFRRAMRAAGMPNTPMLANEIGWYTQGPAGALLKTETQRAALIGGMANQFWRTDCGVSGLAPYSWITMEQDPANPEDWYGLADARTGAPYPSGVAYGDQIRLALGQAADPPPQASLDVCGPKTLTATKTGSGAITSSPAGIDCGQVCSADIADATSVTLTATPASGYAFRGWTGCDSVSGSQCTVSMTSDRAVSANFVARRTVSVQKTGSGTVVASKVGIDCGQTCSAVVDDGDTVILYATPASGYDFAGWSGCNAVTGNQCTVVANSDRVVRATFLAQRTLTAQKSGSGTITSSPAGINCGSDCSEVLDDGSPVTLTATPGSGYAFRGWSGCDSVSGNQCSVTMAADRTVNATFVARRTLTVQTSGAGGVTSSPAGIVCGSDCSEVLDDGTQVTLTATAWAGSAFKGWTGCDSVSGNQCTVTMGGDKTVSANFLGQRTLTVQKTGSGTITSSPAGIDCGSDCGEVLDDGSSVTLTAAPSSGYAFRGWTGCDSVSGSQCTVSMTSDRTVSANFVALRTLTLERTGPGTVSSSPAGISCGTDCSQVLDDGTTIDLTATAERGYRVAGWSGCDSSSGTQCRVTVDSNSSVTVEIVPLAPPDTQITAAKLSTRSGVASFRFAGSAGTGSLTYSCRIDGRAFRSCSGVARYALGRGRHVFEVASTDELGRTDPTPATRTFKVRRHR